MSHKLRGTAYQCPIHLHHCRIYPLGKHNSRRFNLGNDLPKHFIILIMLKLVWHIVLIKVGYIHSCFYKNSNLIILLLLFSQLTSFRDRNHRHFCLNFFDFFFFYQIKDRPPSNLKEEPVIHEDASDNR